MAKTAVKKVNKSEAIREHKAAHPEAKPKEISEELNKKGVKVSPGFVSTILTKSKAKGPKRSTGKKRGRPPGAMANIEKSAHGALDNAFDFVHKVGGLLNAQQLIDKLKAFKERL